MSFYGNNDWLIEVQRGNVPNFSIVHKFGKNPAVGTGAIEDIWYQGGLYAWPTVASTLEAISTSGNDTGAGTGAQTIQVEGLDINGDEISETITMNGLAATAATAASFFRVNRAYVVTSGTYATGITGSHDGTITVRISGAGATQALIGIENSLSLGQTQLARYSLPRNRTAWLLSSFVQIESTGSRTGSAYFQVRENSTDVITPFDARRIRLTPAKMEGNYNFVPRSPVGSFLGPADFWWSGIMDSGGGAGDMSVDFELLVEDTS